MKQWDIFMFPFSRERRHPAVIISNDETCQNTDNDCRMASLPAEGKHEDVPLLHWPLFEVSGDADDGSFGQPIFLLDFGLAVATDEVTGRPYGDGVNGRDGLQK